MPAIHRLSEKAREKYILSQLTASEVYPGSGTWHRDEIASNQVCDAFCYILLRSLYFIEKE